MVPDIALIHPPFGKGDVRKLDICSPPMGLAYIAAFLRGSGYRVSIIDAEVERLNYPQIVDRVDRADIVGITTTAPTYRSALELTNLIKRSNTSTTVVLGGPQATFLDQECLERSAADAVVRGEGEETILDVEGTTVRDGDDIVRNPDRKLIDDLDAIPFPARDLLHMEKYTPANSTGIISSRGCPFRCIFCASSNLYGKKFRSRSAHNVFKEVAELVSKGYSNVTMLDDNFLLNKERAFKFADLVEENNLDFEWSCTGRIDHIDEDLLQRLREVGCNGLFFGIESGSNDTLQLIKKGFTIDQVVNTFDELKNYDYATTASFMIGLPGDDRRKVVDTINLAKQIDPSFAMFSVTTPYPGTELYNNIGNYDLEITIDDWSKFTLTKPVVRTSSLSTAELRRWFLKAYASFYIRASYLKRAIEKKQIGFVLGPLKNTIADTIRGAFRSNAP
jgi:anaerobic magnesium-protoporphyrin IX monomethyl ester cyclase